MKELWDMGADDFGVSGGRIIVRVSPQMLESIKSRSVPYEVVCGDLHRDYTDYRRSLQPGVSRAETFRDYHDPDEVEVAMRRIANAHPDIVAIEEIGRSVEQRPILALRISDNAATIEPDEPGMLAMGCHHAREWISVEVPLFFADYLAENYGKNGAVTRLVNYAEIWIVPVLNPDGFAYSWEGFPNSFEHRWWRKNRRNNSDGTFGVDPNRNYLIGFGDENGSSSMTFSEVYRGPQPFSEPETQAIRDLMTGKTFGRTFKTGLSYHNFSQLVMYPNGYTNSPVTNVDEYRTLASEMTRLINESHTDPQLDYRFGQPTELLYIATGTFEDWAHHAVGAISFIIELRPAGFPFFELPPNEILPTAQENLPAFLYLAEKTLIPSYEAEDTDLDGFVGDDDYCPNSPARAEVDRIGCAESESDIDADGVVNIDDACRDTPAGQQVGASGCRKPVLFTVTVSSNVPNVEVSLIPLDVDGHSNGSTQQSGLTREFADSTPIVLTAPTRSNGNRFLHWTLNGEGQPNGQETLRLEGGENARIDLTYASPIGVEVVGPSRIPDTTEAGFANSTSYQLYVTYSDGVSEPSDGMVTWSLANTPHATIVEGGMLLPYDINAQLGEITAELSASVELGGVVLSAKPISLNIFDALSREPRCQRITIEGLNVLDSLSESVFIARVEFEGVSGMMVVTDQVTWSVQPVTRTTTSMATPNRANVATVSAGQLTTDWVAEETPVVLVAAFVNDDSTVCVAEKEIIIAAGNPGDEPGARSTPATSACGAMGSIGLFSLMIGLGMCLLRNRRG